MPTLTFWAHWCFIFPDHGPFPIFEKRNKTEPAQSVTPEPAKQRHQSPPEEPEETEQNLISKKKPKKTKKMLLQLPRLTNALRDPFDVDQAYLHRKTILQNLNHSSRYSS